MLAQWPVELLHKLPPRVITDIQSALEYGHGERNLKDITDSIQKGDKQVWVHSTEDLFTGTVITEIIQYPRKKTCQIIYLGGDSSLKFLDELQVIEEWARLNNCVDIQVIGRKGWLRVLKNQDYRERYTTVGKEL